MSLSQFEAEESPCLVLGRFAISLAFDSNAGSGRNARAERRGAIPWFGCRIEIGLAKEPLTVETAKGGWKVTSTALVCEACLNPLEAVFPNASDLVDFAGLRRRCESLGWRWWQVQPWRSAETRGAR